MVAPVSIAVIVVVISTIPAVVSAAPVLTTIGGDHAATEQRCASGQQHKNGFHQALLSDLRLFPAYALAFRRDVGQEFCRGEAISYSKARTRSKDLFISCRKSIEDR
jgi:hypothetical protein